MLFGTVITQLMYLFPLSAAFIILDMSGTTADTAAIKIACTLIPEWEMMIGNGN